jgi:acetylglutamate kinase
MSNQDAEKWHAERAQRVDRAKILQEALPYIQQFTGKTVVIKYGGHAMETEELRQSFARDVTLLDVVNVRPVIVHGGGPQIGSVLKRMGIESKFHAGQRVTDAATMDVVEMVLTGRVNKAIVEDLHNAGAWAVGISGKDGRLVEAERLMIHEADGTVVDLGLVGKVRNVNPEVIEALERAGGFIPVVAPVGGDAEGNTYNINADNFAGAIAAALKAEKFILMTDVMGVLDKNSKLISTLDRKQAEAYIADGTIGGGMIPKVQCALDALAGGVKKVHIIDGRVPHAVLLEIFTDRGIGTEIVENHE